jgi:hypothetical protein
MSCRSCLGSSFRGEGGREGGTEGGKEEKEIKVCRRRGRETIEERERKAQAATDAPRYTTKKKSAQCQFRTREKKREVRAWPKVSTYLKLL